MATYRPPIDLKMIGIRIGDQLQFYSDPTVTCIVTQLYPSEVRYKGRLLSLSAAAEEVLNASGAYGGGPDYWAFEGQTLDQRRREFAEWHSRGA